MNAPDKKRILVVFGTRPEAIKLAPVIRELRRCKLEVGVCVTAQHRQMLDQALDMFGIIPDFDLDLMRENQDLTDITQCILVALRDKLRLWQPGWVMVHGDTTTTFAAGLAAFYQKIPVAHVESGLRTGNMYSPWPEEINRRLISHLASLHFAPTEHARQNLLDEGIDNSAIHVTGNTVIDALFKVLRHVHGDSLVAAKLARQFAFLDSTRKLILVTGHRRENLEHGFEGICRALQQLALRDDVEIVYPVHLNPRVREPVFRLLGGLDRVHLIAPLDYVPFVYLMERSFLILTDSGGIQEEASAIGKPVLVMRDTTERPEAVANGVARLVGTAARAIVQEASALLSEPALYRSMANPTRVFGDGRAARRIARHLLRQSESTAFFENDVPNPMSEFESSLFEFGQRPVRGAWRVGGVRVG